MMPVLLQLGPLKVYSYGFFLAVSFAVTIPLLARDVGKHLAPRMGLPAHEGFQKTLDMFTFNILFSILGARLFYVLENFKEFMGNWVSVLYLWDGGLVYYGGLFGAVVSAYFWMKKNRWPMPLFYDLAAAWILLGQAFGRVGCWFSGCCYGIACGPSHGVMFPGGDGKYHLPTQLWELAGDLALCLFILWVRRRTLKKPWATFALYGLTYGVMRFVLEIWRREPADPKFLSVFLSPSQFISAAMVVIGLFVFVWSMTKRQNNPV
jgi:phosphatidylglycerol:prolipoprotein diacylglycerol transferase